MHLYLIALGSNLGDRIANLRAATEAIAAQIGPVLASASVYETAPIGAADRLFLNSALLCSTTLEPHATLEKLLAIEAQLGRVRRERWGNRTIDLDILIWRPQASEHDDAAGVIQSPTLTLPHPAMLERDFVLVPACDIAGDWRHPLSGRRLAVELKERVKVAGGTLPRPLDP